MTMQTVRSFVALVGTMMVLIALSVASVVQAAHASSLAACGGTLTPYTAVTEGTAPDNFIVSVAGFHHRNGAALGNNNRSHCSNILIRDETFDNRTLIVNISDALEPSNDTAAAVVVIVVEDCVFRNDAALIITGADGGGGMASRVTVDIKLRRLSFNDSTLLVAGLSLRGASSGLTVRDSTFERRDGKTLTELNGVLRIPALLASIGPFKWHRDSVTSALHVAGDTRIDGAGTTVRLENLTAVAEDRKSASYASWDRDGRVAAAVSIGNSQRGGGLSITGGASWVEEGLFLRAVGEIDDAACRLASQAEITVAGPGSILSIARLRCNMTTPEGYARHMTGIWFRSLRDLRLSDHGVLRVEDVAVNVSRRGATAYGVRVAAVSNLSITNRASLEIQHVDVAFQNLYQWETTAVSFFVESDGAFLVQDDASIAVSHVTAELSAGQFDDAVAFDLHCNSLKRAEVSNGSRILLHRVVGRTEPPFVKHAAFVRFSMRWTHFTVADRSTIAVHDSDGASMRTPYGGVGVTFLFQELRSSLTVRDGSVIEVRNTTFPSRNTAGFGQHRGFFFNGAQGRGLTVTNRSSILLTDYTGNFRSYQAAELFAISVPHAARVYLGSHSTIQLRRINVDISASKGTRLLLIDAGGGGALTFYDHATVGMVDVTARDSLSADTVPLAIEASDGGLVRVLDATCRLLLANVTVDVEDRLDRAVKLAYIGEKRTNLVARDPWPLEPWRLRARCVNVTSREWGPTTTLAEMGFNRTQEGGKGLNTTEVVLDRSSLGAVVPCAPATCTPEIDCNSFGANSSSSSSSTRCGEDGSSSSSSTSSPSRPLCSCRCTSLCDAVVVRLGADARFLDVDPDSCLLRAVPWRPRPASAAVASPATPTRTVTASPSSDLPPPRASTATPRSTVDWNSTMTFAAPAMIRTPSVDVIASSPSLSPLSPPPPPPVTSRTASAGVVGDPPVATPTRSASLATAPPVVIPVPDPAASAVTRPIPPSVSASAAVLSGVLLPSSANKPMANVRALELADACLAATGGNDAATLDAAEPGEWPSDFAVLVARWDLGGGGGAYARAAGAAVVVAMISVVGLVLVIRRAAALDDVGGAASDMTGHTDTLTTVVPTAATVTAAYLVPNALEGAVAAVVGGGHTTTIAAAGAIGAVAMLAATAPLFVATPLSSVGATAEEAGDVLTSTTTATAEPTTVRRSSSQVTRIARVMSPVIADGLRTNATPAAATPSGGVNAAVDGAPPRLRRCHAALDFGVACGIAILSGFTRAGGRVLGSCVVAAAAMAFLSLGLTAYYVVVRPYTSRLEVAVAAAQAATLAALCVLTFAAVASDGSAVSGDTLSLVGVVAEAVTFAAPVLLVVPVLWAQLCGGNREVEKKAEAVDVTDVAKPLLIAPASSDPSARAGPGETSPSSDRPELPLGPQIRNPLA